MEELFEYIVDNPVTHYAAENPRVALAAPLAALSGSLGVIGFGGKIAGDRDIKSLKNSNDLEDVEAELESRKEELEEKIKRDSAWREMYNHVRHIYDSGKLGAYQSEIGELQYTADKEYHNQKFSDEDLEFLD